MNNRIILTQKASQLLNSTANPSPQRQLPLLDTTMKSQRLLLHLSSQILSSRLTTDRRSQKDKELLAAKIRQQIGPAEQPPSQYILNRIETIADKLARESGGSNVPQHTIISSSAYIDKLQHLHNQKVNKYQSLQQKMLDAKTNSVKSFKPPEKPESIGINDTHYKTRFRERLRNQSERKYGASHSEMRLPKVPKKYQTNWIQNELRMRRIKDKYFSERQSVLAKQRQSTIASHLQ